jgi:hypothetical protein
MSDGEVDYGKLNKRVVFSDNEHRHAQLVLKLKHDGFKQGQFFRTIITGYINDDPVLQQFVDEMKEQSPRLKKKARRLRDQGEETMSALGFNEDDIENIFDLIEQEHPDL